MTPALSNEVAERLASLQGCEQAVLAPSTLHLFWELKTLLGNNALLCMDSGLYPLGRWGVDRAVMSGLAAREFRHHDPDSLTCLLKKRPCRTAVPVIVTDGFCPRCGKAAPVREYLRRVRRFGGLLVIDDTQALGILGSSPAMDSQYGRGGGGMLRWAGVSGPDIVLVSSLAKGFGAPLAALSGSRDVVWRFIKRSKTRMYCSPPSTASIKAAEHALYVNNRFGDRLRLRLANLVCRFRNKLLEKSGLSLAGGIFPVQSIILSEKKAVAVHKDLWTAGVRTVLMSRQKGFASIGFIITVLHSENDIDFAVEELALSACRT